MRNHGSTLSTGFTGRRLLASLAILGLGLAPIAAENAVAEATGPQPCFTSVTPGVAPAGTIEPDLVNGVYQIASKENLVWLSWATSEYNTASSPAITRSVALASDYQQVDSINLGGCVWSPIGVGEYELEDPFGLIAGQPFTGSYDGGLLQGFSISGLYVEPSLDVPDGLADGQGQLGHGLFGTVQQKANAAPAIIRNISVRGAIGSADKKATDRNIGLLVGVANGNVEIKNAHADGTIATNIGRAGGLVGRTNGSAYIESSSADVEIVSDNEQVGGLVGVASGRSSGVQGGGVPSEFQLGVTVTQSFTTGSIDVTGTNAGELGGLIGLLSSDGDGHVVEFSFSRVNITSDRRAIGGLVGRATIEETEANINDSYFAGSLSRSNNETTGGLVGHISVEPVLKNNYSSGLVKTTDTAATQLGALLGTNVLTLDTTEFDTAPFSRNFVDTSKTGSLLPVAWFTQFPAEKVKGLSTTEMTSFATFKAADWDIVEGWAEFNPDKGQVWGICSGINDGYPFLLWQYTSNPCGGDVDSGGGDGDGGAVVTTPGSGSNPNPSSTGSSNQASGIHMDLQGTVGGVASSTPVVIGGQGLAPGSSYSLVLREPVTTLRSGVVGTDGRFSLRANLPATVAPGTYTLTLTATTVDGSILTLTQMFTVGVDGRFSSIGPVTGSQSGGLAATGVPGSVAVGALSVAALLMVMGAVMVVARRRAEVLQR